MTEIYWITRLDVIWVVSLVVFLTGAIWSIGYIIVSEDSIGNIFKKIKWLIVTDVFALLILVFVPTTREALVIYGLGTTKDWIENNEKVKEIPQKAIDALDKYLSEE